MEQVIVDRNLIMLDGKPLALVAPSGLSKWKSEGVSFTCRYDQITAGMRTQREVSLPIQEGGVSRYLSASYCTFVT